MQLQNRPWQDQTRMETLLNNAAGSIEVVKSFHAQVEVK